MPIKPEPLPKPSTKADLTNIASKDHLEIWDQYICAILQGIHAFHGAASSSSAGQAAEHAAVAADKMMELRQERAQGHIDQGIVEKAKEKAQKDKEKAKK